MFYNWGAVPGCITGQFSGVDMGGTIQNCPAFPELNIIDINIHAWWFTSSWW